MRLKLTPAALAIVAFGAFTPVAAVLAQTAATTAPATTAPASTAPTTTGTTMAAPATSGLRAPAATVNQTPQTTSAPNASAVQTNNTNSRTSAAPVPGRNSFTVGEARRRITASGYTNVMGLKKDRQGIWRGQAQKDGASTAVALDYQGNVVSQ